MNSFFAMLLLLLFSKNSDALECNASNEGQVIDLYSNPARPDGPTPFAHFELQDQDGLGTCYANNMALMLEGELPGNPQVSYQQIAMAYGLSFNSYSDAPATRLPTSYVAPDGSTRSIVEGGWSCMAFDAVRSRHGFLCDRDSTPVERSGHTQDSVIRSLGRFYDSFSRLMPEEEAAESDSYKAAENLRQNLRSFARQLNDERGASCVFPRVEPRPPSVMGVLESLCVSTHTQILTLEEEKTALEASTERRTASERERLRVITRQLRQLRQQLGRLGTVNEIAETGENGLKSLNDKNGGQFVLCQLSTAVTEAVTNTYYRPLESGGTTIRSSLQALETQLRIPHELVNHQSEAQLRARFSADFDYASAEHCRRSEGLMVFYETDSIISSFSDQYHMCLSREFAAQFGLAVQSLSRMSGDGLAPDSLLDALSRLDLGFADFVGGVISPECYADDSTHHISIPENLSCQTQYYPSLGRRYEDSSGEKITDPELLRPLQMADATTTFSQQVARTIEQGRPLGISLCTNFFTDPAADSSFTANCAMGGVHAMHALTVSGVRCQNGAPQYLLQNSWGRGCSNYHSSYECQSERGSFWVPQDVLVRNINQSYSLDRDVPPPPPPVLGPAGQNNRERNALP